MGKGENAGDQHFLTMFSKGFFFRVIKSRDCGVNLTIYHMIQTFNTAKKEGFEKITWEKEKNTDYQHFLLFPEFVLPFQREKLSTLDMLPADAYSRSIPKVCHLIKSKLFIAGFPVLTTCNPFPNDKF